MKNHQPRRREDETGTALVAMGGGLREKYMEAVTHFTDEAKVDHDSLKAAFATKPELLIKRRKDIEACGTGQAVTFLGLGASTLCGIYSTVGLIGTHDVASAPYISAPLAVLMFLGLRSCIKNEKQVNKTIQQDVKKFEETRTAQKALPPPMI
jgi:hypothetical protein